MLNLNLIKDSVVYGSNSRNKSIVINGDYSHALELFKKHNKKLDVVLFSIEDYIKTNNLSSVNILLDDSLASSFESLFKDIKNILSTTGAFVLHVRDKNSWGFKELLVKVFGFDNYQTTFHWDNTRNNQNLTTKINDSVEYFYTFSKSNSDFTANQLKFSVEDDKSYNLKDAYFSAYGKYKLMPLDSSSFAFNPLKGKPIMINDFLCYAGGSEKETRKKIWNWLWTPEVIKDKYEKGIVVIKKDSKRNPRLFKKQYQFVDDVGLSIVRKVNYKNLILNTNNNSTKQEFESNTNSKATNIIPKEVLKYIVQALSSTNSSVLELNSIHASLASSIVELNSDLDCSRTVYTVANDSFSKDILLLLNSKNKEVSSRFNSHTVFVDFSIFYFVLSFDDSPLDIFNVDSHLEHLFYSQLAFHFSAFSKNLFFSAKEKITISHNETRSLVLCLQPFPTDDTLAILRDFSNIRYNNNKPILASFESFLCDSRVSELDMDSINLLDILNK